MTLKNQSNPTQIKFDTAPNTMLTKPEGNPYKNGTLSDDSISAMRKAALEFSILTADSKKNSRRKNKPKKNGDNKRKNERKYYKNLKKQR